MCTKQYIHIGELLTCAVSVVIWGETDHGLATRLHVSEPGYDSGAMCPKMCVQDLAGPSSSMPMPLCTGHISSPAGFQAMCHNTTAFQAICDSATAHNQEPDMAVCLALCHQAHQKNGWQDRGLPCPSCSVCGVVLLPHTPHGR